jgi:tetratricopeptide (TPR) repeat protein
MRGRYYWSLKRNRENIQIAIKFFDEAISLDPSYAAAYAGRADCYALTTNVLYGPIKTSEANPESDLRCAESDRNRFRYWPRPNTSMGMIHLRYDWDWQEAEKEFKLALELNPNYAPAHFWYSNLLVVTRRFDEALREAAAGKSQDPYSHVSAVNYARVSVYMRDALTKQRNRFNRYSLKIRTTFRRCTYSVWSRFNKAIMQVQL